MLYVAWKRELPRKFARFVPFRTIKKRSVNLLCVLDLSNECDFFWSVVGFSVLWLCLDWLVNPASRILNVYWPTTCVRCPFFLSWPLRLAGRKLQQLATSQGQHPAPSSHQLSCQFWPERSRVLQTCLIQTASPLWCVDSLVSDGSCPTLVSIVCRRKYSHKINAYPSLCGSSNNTAELSR